MDESNDLSWRLATDCSATGLPSIGFVAASADEDRARAAARSAGRWPHLELVHCPPDTLHSLGVSIVPSRLVVDCSTGRIVKWWDGTHGNVLKGAHGKSRANGSHDFLGTLANLL